MQDGDTRKLTTASGREVEAFFCSYSAAIVILSGAASGTESQLDQTRITLGRGPGVDLAFDDAAMSRQHAALDLAGGGFRITDLDSTNGVVVNGSECRSADLKHGDRFELGEHRFQYVLEERDRSPREYELPES